MRFAAVLAAALLLSGCAWVKDKLPWNAPLVTTPAPTPKPAEPAKPTEPPKPEPQRPRPAPAEAPAPQLRGDMAPAETDAQHQARCRAMADNRADDAKGLGASAADQNTMRDETFHDCMQGAVK